MSDEHQTENNSNRSGSTDPTLAGREHAGGAATAKRKKTGILALGLGLVAVVIGVVVAITVSGGNNENSEASVVLGVVLPPSNLDTLTTSGVALDQVLIDNVYEGLVGRDAQGNYIPSLAASWDISDDSLTYTFHLAEGTKFSNGNPLGANEVVWSIERLRDTEGFVAHSELALVTSVTATDEQTVEIVLSQPNPDLLWSLSGRAGLVYDPLAQYDPAVTAVGSGPFLLAEWKEGDSITLVRNEDYWGEAAKVAEVVFRYIDEPSAAINALRSGDIDAQLPILDVALRSQVEELDGYSLIEGDASDKWVLAFNNGAEPFTDIRVRQALRHAIDNQALITSRGNVDHLLGGPIYSGDPGYEELDIYPYNPQRAQELLAEAGYGDGLNLELIIPNIYGTAIPDLLVSQFNAVGVTLTVQSVEFPTWLNDVYINKDYQLSIVDHAEARDFVNWTNPDYYFSYDNLEVQRLYAEAKVATDDAEHERLLAEAARIVSEEAAADWLFNFRTLSAVSDSLEGLPTDNINSRLDVTGLSKKG